MQPERHGCQLSGIRKGLRYAAGVGQCLSQQSFLDLQRRLFRPWALRNMGGDQRLIMPAQTRPLHESVHHLALGERKPVFAADGVVDAQRRQPQVEGFIQCSISKTGNRTGQKEILLVLPRQLCLPLHTRYPCQPVAACMPLFAGGGLDAQPGVAPKGVKPEGNFFLDINQRHSRCRIFLRGCLGDPFVP